MKILFGDTETGGLDPNKHSLLQIGMAIYDTELDKVIGKLNLFVKQEDYIVTATAMDINKLVLKDVYNDGVTKEDAVRLIDEFLVKNEMGQQPVLAGHNFSMDKYFLRKLYSDVGRDMDKTFNHRMIDIMGLLWTLYIKGKIPESACSSYGCLNHFGIKITKEHDALQDALYTLEVYRKILSII